LNTFLNYGVEIRPLLQHQQQQQQQQQEQEQHTQTKTLTHTIHTQHTQHTSTHQTTQVERCKYCVAEGETLLSKMQIFAPDMNWLRLWAVNGADDGLRQREKARANTHALIHSFLSTAVASFCVWQRRSSFQFRLGCDSVYLSPFLYVSVNPRRANHRTICVVYTF
jgi:hypothetical protein